MSDDKTIKILFFGDIVGKPGRIAVKDFLSENNYKDYFVIANVENASHGFGLTEKNYNDISEYGVDCMTSGNHIWDKRDLYNYIDKAEKLIRPLNYPKETTPGEGYKILSFKDYKIGVISILGRVFMSPVDSQWEIIKDTIAKIKEITPIVIIDFHAEATAEKVCFARYCSELGCSAFFGTHTHVQTADEKIINGMGYITDAGFCGAEDSVIGMDYKSSLNRFLTCIPERYEIADSETSQINAVEVEINPETGYAIDIKRIFSSRKNIEKEGSQ